MQHRSHRSRQDGRQHARAAAPRGPRGRRLRPQPRRRRRRHAGGAGQGARTPRASCGSWSRRAPDATTTIAELAELLEPGRPRHRRRQLQLHRRLEHAELLGAKGIGYVDCGVSGGVWGLENGYGLMVRRRRGDVEQAMPIFDALRPEGPREEGFVHAGPVGAGHYTKMVHNGIEYGLMQAYAEGYELLEAKDIVNDVPGRFKAWTPRHRRPVLAARPAGRGARGGPGPRRDQRLRRRLRRGPLDGRGGHRQLGADAGHLGRAVRPVRLPPGRLPGDEGGRRAAQPVRRARRAPRRAPSAGRDGAPRATGAGAGRRARPPAPAT